MAKAYTRDDIIGAYLMRFLKNDLDISVLAKNADTHYDKVGKEQFRKDASVDAEAMKEYFNWI